MCNYHALNLIPLITRRYNLRFIMLYKLQHCLVDIGDCNILRPGDQRTRGTYRLYRPPVTLCDYKYSFFPRMVNYWNRLPTRVKDCHTLEEFKAAVIPAAFSPTLVYKSGSRCVNSFWAHRGYGDLGRMSFYFQGAWEH